MKNAIATTILASVFVAGSVLAAPLKDFEGSSADVNVVINSGIATLTGHVESNLDRTMAAKSAAELEGVEEVRNLITLER